MKSTKPNGHGSLYKEVRFSPTATPVRRAQSVSTSNPLRSEKRWNFQGTGTTVETTDALSILEESRRLQESREVHFQNERALFAREKALWEGERRLLLGKIQELEVLLGDARAGQQQQQQQGGDTDTDRDRGWDRGRRMHFQPWTGLGGSKPTRVFQGVEELGKHAISIQQSRQMLGTGSLDDHHPPSLDAAVPVPIEKLDSKLDGITLKSTALPPEVVARVMTPPSPVLLDNDNHHRPTSSSPSSLSSPPSSTSACKPAADAKHWNHSSSHSKLRLSDLGPPQENLVRDAGHTPMAIIDEAEIEAMSLSQPATQSSSSCCPLDEAEDEEHPIAPVTTQVRQPREQADSYFPDVLEAENEDEEEEQQQDPALTGPLSLLNDEKHDRSFLQELDHRLLDQARRILATSSDSPERDGGDADDASDQGEPEPELKFKNATNFGTAFGLSNG
ncbi:hypothetical protein ASPZODRAFT_62407 [Penicilliopsis zonata CBS 506.65]|uniref:Uncharacterized protein n=1 Tax=Penicilliopsis zonata CBS 506.65 TaxID=1073090 RepID=A0A1L9SMM7_9EURO|nr:hypothetical protein ASPZODRAFT_62407 [Penicilliopsis zonata CBS 506.65]OJJ48287.1 hypothetical protein ASPZODRAFT_62407 [Penicilliopsis zonata CBS 506.65]